MNHNVSVLLGALPADGQAGKTGTKAEKSVAEFRSVKGSKNALNVRVQGSFDPTQPTWPSKIVLGRKFKRI